MSAICRFYTETRWLFKVLNNNSKFIEVEHIEDTPPFRKYKGANIIDIFTMGNWIEERDVKEEIINTTF